MPPAGTVLPRSRYVLEWAAGNKLSDVGDMVCRGMPPGACEVRFGDRPCAKSQAVRSVVRLDYVRPGVSRFLESTRTVRSGSLGFRLSITSYPTSQRWHQISSRPGRRTRISRQFGQLTSAFSHGASMTVPSFKILARYSRSAISIATQMQSSRLFCELLTPADIADSPLLGFPLASCSFPPAA